MRYIPHSDKTLKQMLDTIGVSDFEQLINRIPSDLRIKDGFDTLPMTEIEVTEKYKEIASRNTAVSEMDSYIGGGAYEHFIPSVVNHLGNLPQFVTSYTPYQPESSQGMLQALFEYQTMMCMLTGTDVSNSSHYDGATSLAEAALIAYRRKPGKIVFSRYLNPFYRKVLKTYFGAEQKNLIEYPAPSGVMDMNIDEDQLSAVIVQSPNFLGFAEDIKKVADMAHEKDALLIASVNPMSLGVFEAPGILGADIVTGEGQPLGNPLNFGGPYFGFICAKKEHMRKIPGRIVGRTKDRLGRTGYVLTLQAREQHIRREKATSNICSNQALCALRAAIFLSYLGDRGFKNLSLENFEKAHFLYSRLMSVPGVKPLYDRPFFNEFTISIKEKDSDSLLLELRKYGISGGISLKKYYPELKDSFLIAVTETKSFDDLVHYEKVLREVTGV